MRVFVKKKWKMLGFPVAVVAAIGLLAIGGGGYWLSTCVTRPLNPGAPEVVFVISPGQGLSLVAANLEDKHIIASKTCFILHARLKRAAATLKAGEYLVSASLSPARILDIFIQGKERLVSITIPEGFAMEAIAQKFAEKGWCGREEFLTLCRDPDFIRELNIPSHTLEGYLFPDTYFFPAHARCRKIIRKMTDTFQAVFTPDWRARADEMGFSVQEIVTLASMIEMETADPSERPLISSVFHNRLKRQMRLESDPTVIYGDTEFKGRIRTKHLRRETPYNTYTISGLPPGPIASPGAKALEAALYPEDSPYLFFVSRNDRTHHFSTTLTEHNRAVEKYQLKR